MCSATHPQLLRDAAAVGHQLLRNPAPGDTVASIAEASGYRSMGLFSIEFQQRFHIKPSQLLRQARAHWPS